MNKVFSEMFRVIIKKIHSLNSYKLKVFNVGKSKPLQVEQPTAATNKIILLTSRHMHELKTLNYP